MKPTFIVSLLLGLAWSGCGQKETPAPVTAPKAPPAAAPAMPSLTSTPAAPPPPGAATTAAVVPAAPSAQMPAFEGKDETERLTAALRAYGQDPNAPAVTNFEPLVKARLIKSIPVPPPGKKYVIDMKQCEVRLENR